MKSKKQKAKGKLLNENQNWNWNWKILWDYIWSFGLNEDRLKKKENFFPI